MYFHKAYVGALTNLEGWVIFERNKKNDVITVSSVEGRTNKGPIKSRCQALDIMIELSMRALAPVYSRLRRL